MGQLDRDADGQQAELHVQEDGRRDVAAQDGAGSEVDQEQEQRGESKDARQVEQGFVSVAPVR